MGLKRFVRNWFRHDSNVRKSLTEIKESLADLESSQEHIMVQIRKNQECQRIYMLQDKALHSTESGISGSKLCEEEVVISLTSYGPRIKEAYLAIESIMQGSVLPNHIVLWLSEEERNNDLPVTLLNQSRRGLQIEFCSDIRSYKKLIPSLKKFPKACIITIDDDLIYDFDLVENLINTHKLRPEVVCANRIHKIVLGLNGRPVSYLNWAMCSRDYSDSRLNFLTSGGGALFPPEIFPKEIFDENVFMKICSDADDIWINAMLLLKGVPVVKSFTHSFNGCDYVELIQPQGTALSSSNNDSLNCRNDVQLKAVFDYYDLYCKLSE